VVVDVLVQMLLRRRWPRGRTVLVLVLVQVYVLLRLLGLLLRASHQGLTLVHFSAQRNRFLWDRGCV
jgi:hypothetical protein